MGFLKKSTAIVLSAVMITTTFGVAGAAFGVEKKAEGKSAAVKTTAPKKVSGLKIKRRGFRSATLRWKKSEDVDGYEVKAVYKATVTKKVKKKRRKKKTIRKTKTFSLKTRVLKGTATSTHYRKLKTKNKYKFTIRAYNVVNGKKKYSEAVSTDYLIPGYLKKETVTKTTATIKWAKLTRAAKYNVVVMNKKGKKVKTVSVTKKGDSGNVVNATKVSNLKSSSKYKVKIVADFPGDNPSKTDSLTVRTKSTYIWPVNGRILSGFGPRTGFGSHYHKGIDISAHMGKKIKAARDGKVILARWYSGYGKCVEIRHSDGIITLYGHLSKIKVHKGQKVSQGQVIGNAGMTGRASGAHLHYGVFKHGKLINPRPYLP